jgi:DNA-binding SARP family transcriptional activator
MPLWQIRLFGKLELEDPAGSITTFRGTLAGALLAHLALNAGSAQSRELLAEMFWPESDSVNKRTRLRQEIRTLRATFGDEADSPLRITHHELELLADTVSTDVARFASKLQQASTPASAAEKEQLTESAIHLYRDDLLPEYPDLAVAERTAFAHQYEEALRSLARMKYERGEYGGAIQALNRLVAYNPLIEEAYVDLMRVYAAQGQPSMIRRQLAALEQALREGLDEEPADSTRRLAQELLASASVGAVPPPVEEQEERELPVFQPVPSSELPAAKPVSFRRSAFLVTVIAGLVLSLGYFALRHRSAPHTATPVVPPLQSRQEKWTYTYPLHRGEQGDSEAGDVVIDKEWNVYVTGLVQTPKDDSDILTCGLNANGTLRWADRYSSPEHDCDRAYGITYDGKNGVYVVGETYVPEKSQDREGWHLVVIHYTKDGKRLWVRRTQTTTHNDLQRMRIQANPQGGVFVGGTAFEYGVKQMLLLRYDEYGHLCWERRYAGARQSTLSDMATDKFGNVYACGSALQPTDQFSSNDDWLTVSYDANGNLRWARTCDGPGHSNDTAQRIAVDNASEAVNVAGLLYTGNPGEHGHGMTAAVVRYRLDGTPVWTRQELSSGQEAKLAVVTVSGHTHTVTLAATTISPSHDSEVVLTQYDQFGSVRWTRRLHPAGLRSTTAIQIAPFADGDEESIVMTGITSNQHEQEMHIDSDILTAAFRHDGRIRWQRVYRAEDGSNRPSAVQMDEFGRALVVVGQVYLPNSANALVVLRY